MAKSVKEMNELELFFVIDGLGAFIWQMSHDIGRGRIPESSEIKKDIIKMQNDQKEAIQELTRFGIDKPLNEDNSGTDAYWVWYRTWNKWKSDMTNEQWNIVNNATRKGILPEDVIKWKSEAFKGTN